MSHTDPHKPDDSSPTVPVPPLAEAADSGMNLGAGMDPKADPGSDSNLQLGETPPATVGSAVDLGGFQAPSAGSDSIRVANLPDDANPPSAQSLTSWTDVIRRQRAALEAGGSDSGIQPPVRMDAPSDKDLLARLAEIPAKGETPSSAFFGKTADTSEIPEADLPVYSPPPEAGPAAERPSAAEIDLGRLYPSPGGSNVEGSEVGFDILYPPSDAGGAMPLPPAIDLPPLSASEFDRVMTGPRPRDYPAEDDDSIPFATDVGPGASSVPIGEAIPMTSTEGSRSSILDVLIADAGGAPSGEPRPTSDVLDYGQAESPFQSRRPTMPTAGATGIPPVPTQPGFEMPVRATPIPGTGSGADWPPPPGADPLDLAGPASGIGSDDAVDLYAEAAAVPPSISDSGSLEISERALEEAHRRSEIMESSSVDLSSRPSFSGSEFDIALSGPSDVAHAAQASEHEIDLSLPAAENEADSSMVHPRGKLEANQAALAAALDARRRTDGGPEKDEPAPIRPVRREKGPPPSRGREYLFRGAAVGLLIGAGGVLGAYFAGILPGRGTAAPAESAAEIDRLRKEADAARAEARNTQTRADLFMASVRKSLSGAGVPNPDNTDEGIRMLADAKSRSDTTIRDLTNAANTARAEAATARSNLAAARKEADAAKAELANARGAADPALAALTKALKDAGFDTAKPEDGVKKLAGAVTAAEAKEKAASAKLTEAVKKAEDAAKSADDAQRAVAEAVKGRDASDAVVRAVGDRLAKAKFVGDKPDSAALVKGIDDAIKAASSDATAGLRDELAKARADEAKAKSDLTAAKGKEADAAKKAQALQAEADKLAADLKAAGERLTNETAKLRDENTRLARDLEAVKELAAAIRTPGSTLVGPIPKPEPGKLADRAFGDGLRAYYNGQYGAAESHFRKAITFSPDDARYHYLLGLTLWVTDDKKGAEAEFEKGRDLEVAGRPASRLISALLERVQGPARQAVNAYRP
jgi:chemotaxis protein histidine kinase CheA